MHSYSQDQQQEQSQNQQSQQQQSHKMLDEIKSPAYTNENSNSSINDHKSDFSHEQDPPDHSPVHRESMKSPSKNDPDDIEKVLKEAKVVEDPLSSLSDTDEGLGPILATEIRPKNKKHRPKRHRPPPDKRPDTDSSDEESTNVRLSDRSRSKSIDNDMKKRGRPKKMSSKTAATPTWPSIPKPIASKTTTPIPANTYESNSDTTSTKKSSSKSTPKKSDSGKKKSSHKHRQPPRSEISSLSHSDDSSVEMERPPKSKTSSKSAKLKGDCNTAAGSSMSSGKHSSKKSSKPSKSKTSKSSTHKKSVTEVTSSLPESEGEILPPVPAPHHLNISHSDCSSASDSDINENSYNNESRKKKIEKPKTDSLKNSALSRLFVPGGKGKGGAKGGAKGAKGKGQVVVITNDEQTAKSNDSMNSSGASPTNTHFVNNSNNSSSNNIKMLSPFNASNHAPPPSLLQQKSPHKSPQYLGSTRMLVKIDLGKIDMTRLREKFMMKNLIRKNLVVDDGEIVSLKKRRNSTYPHAQNLDETSNGKWNDVKPNHKYENVPLYSNSLEHQENGKINNFFSSASDRLKEAYEPTVKKEFNPIFDSPPRSLDAKYLTPSKSAKLKIEHKIEPHANSMSPSLLKEEKSNLMDYPDQKLSQDPSSQYSRRKRSNSSCSDPKGKRRKRNHQQPPPQSNEQLQNDQLPPTNHDRLAGPINNNGGNLLVEPPGDPIKQDLFQKPIYVSYFERNSDDWDQGEIR